MKTLLALLSMIPGLSATEPLPPNRVTPSIYYDFETTLVEKYHDDSQQYNDRGTCYKINVKNTGEGYISFISMTFNGGFSPYKTVLEENDSRNYVIAPNHEANFIISAYYDTDSLNNFTIIAEAYTAFTDELVVTGTKTITSEKCDGGYYNYIDMSFDNDLDNHYCYGATIKAYVDGKESYFIVNECDDFSFMTSKEVKGDENGVVEVVKLFKTEYAYYSHTGYVKQGGNGCNGSIICLAPTIAPLGLITTFVIALSRAHKKKYSK